LRRRGNAFSNELITGVRGLLAARMPDVGEKYNFLNLNPHQRALKIMAWSKTKTAAVATVAVMLTAGTTTLVIETVHLSRVGVYQPIRDNEPDITARVRGLKMEELSAEDCTPEFWRQLHQSPLFNNPAVVKGLAAALGPLRTVTLVERTEIHGRPNYLYRMKYQKMNVLFLIVFDGDKIAFAKGYPEPK
jgi:hypothetical protein